MLKRVVLAGAALLAVAPAMAQRTVTLDEVSRDEAALGDQVWGVFVPASNRWRARTRSPGDSVMVQSRVYPTVYPGMCRQDHAVMLFAPAQDGVRAPGDTTPMRAYGIDNTPYYRFYRDPGPDAPDFSDPWPGGVWDGPCSKLTYDNRFFKAPDEETAFEGYRAVLAARVAVTSGRVRLGRCRPPRDSGWRCDTLFAEGGPVGIRSIKRCDARPDTACFIVWNGVSVHVRIVVTDEDDSDRENAVMVIHSARRAGRVLRVDVDFDDPLPLGGLD